MIQPHLNAPVLILLSALAVIRFSRTPNGGRSQVLFLTGLLLFSLCAGSPFRFPFLDSSFSGHMISHVLIILVAAPLLVLDIDADPVPLRGLEQRGRLLLKNHSWLAWILGMATMWFWHIPFVFQQAQENMHSGRELFSFLQSASLLLGGMAFAFPVLGRIPGEDRSSLVGLVYLFTACFACSLLGLLITFAPAAVYAPAKAIMPMPGMMNPGATEKDQLADQQAAGLIMWVPCCFVYLAGCLYIFYRWFHEKEAAGPLAGSLLS